MTKKCAALAEDVVPRHISSSMEFSYARCTHYIELTKPYGKGVMASIKIQFNKDNTITVRVGRAIEHISTTGKTKAEIFDAVKYAAISKGATLDDLAITETLYKVI